MPAMWVSVSCPGTGLQEQEHLRQTSPNLNPTRWCCLISTVSRTREPSLQRFTAAQVEDSYEVLLADEVALVCSA